MRGTALGTESRGMAYQSPGMAHVDVLHEPGGDYEQAVVKEVARAALSRWDERVSHHEIAIDLQ